MRTKMLCVTLTMLMVFSAFMVVAPTYAWTKEEAILAGMGWLAIKQNADGSWGTTPEYAVGDTGLAVLKFETYAVEHNLDPFDLSYPFHFEVRSGLDYIFANAHTMAIGMQTHGNPDTDGDGIGVYFVSPTGWERTYETGIAMMAIAHSTHPGAVVNVAGSPVNGWKYKEVLQDAVDYLAFGQVDSGPQRGGWDYSETNNADGWADNSNTGYAVLGLGYAEASPPGGFELTIPEFVKNELDVWVEYIQDPVSGGSGYGSPGSWVNILKTGNLLYEMKFLGDSISTPRVKRAISYIVTHWYDLDYIGWRGPGPGGDPTWPACYQNMYCAMKGLEAFGNETYDGIHWQDDFETVLLAQQNLDGSWPNAPFFGAADGRPYTPPGGWAWDTDQIKSTEWALLTLEKAVPPPPPPTLKDVKDEIKAIEEKLDLYLPDIELKLDTWLPDIKTEIKDIELKLDTWLPDIKSEILKIEDKLDFWLPEIKKEIEHIEWKLDYTIDKETVDIQILTGKDMGTGTQILKNKFVYYMMTTVAGQTRDYTKIEIEAEATTINPSQYTVTTIKTGVYRIEINKDAVPVGTKLIVIKVECKDPSGVIYYGAAITTAYNVG